MSRPKTHSSKRGEGWIYVLIHRRRGEKHASVEQQTELCNALISKRLGEASSLKLIGTVGTNQDRLLERGGLRFLSRQRFDFLIAASRDIKQNRVAKRLISAAEKRGIEIVLVDEAEHSA